MAEHSTVGLESLRMYEILKTEKFAMLFSFIIGFGAVAMLIPVCKGDECFVKKAPSIDDMKSSTYRIGSKCYQFAPETISCPTTGVIESFAPVPPGFMVPMSF